MKFPAALNMALKAKIFIRRTGWRNKFHLELTQADATATFLMRQHDNDDLRIPWGVITEDDMLAEDWELCITDLDSLDDKVLAEARVLDKGTTPWAMARLLEGADLFMENGPLWIELVELERVGPAFILHLPNGDEKLFRFAPVDLHKEWTVREAS